MSLVNLFKISFNSFLDRQNALLHHKVSVCNPSRQRKRWHREAVCNFLHQNVPNEGQPETSRWPADDTLLKGVWLGREGAGPRDGIHRRFDELSRPFLLSCGQNVLADWAENHQRQECRTMGRFEFHTVGRIDLPKSDEVIYCPRIPSLSYRFRSSPERNN